MSDVPKKVYRKSYKGVRLTEFHVEKLFDEFTYTIPLKLDSRVTAIIAPNGAGKTLCLRLISGLFGQKWSVFTASTFLWVSYKFSEGTTVTIEQILHPASASFESQDSNLDQKPQGLSSVENLACSRW